LVTPSFRGIGCGRFLAERGGIGRTTIQRYCARDPSLRLKGGSVQDDFVVVTSSFGDAVIGGHWVRAFHAGRTPIGRTTIQRHCARDPSLRLKGGSVQDDFVLVTPSLVETYGESQR
jgi:hypothetical protein